MSIVNLGIEGDSSAVYELISIIDIKGCDGNLVYEIHNQSTADRTEPNTEFVNRSKPFYKTYINPGFVDQWASNDISYAVKIDDVWYFVADTGSNTYLGSGPTSTLALREFCFKKGIKILYIENSFKEWKEGLLSEQNKHKESIPAEIRTLSQSYNRINQIISFCGEGLSKINVTAGKLLENNHRDLFLAAIYSHKQDYIVEAEAMNKEGRTDLMVYDLNLGSRPPFIYEFKIHKNSDDITRGLDQITKQYSTVNNRYNGLVLINRKRCDLSDIITTITTLLSKYNLNIERTEPYNGDHRLVVHHKHPLDRSINCILTIFLFDIQQFLLPAKKKSKNKPTNN